MLWIGLGGPGGGSSARNSFRSLMQNLSLVGILALSISADIKRILQSWKDIPQKLETMHLPSQPALIGHFYLVIVSILGSKSTSFWGPLQTWVEHHNAVPDSPSVEQSNTLRLSGERFNLPKSISSVRQIILGLISLVSVFSCFSHFSMFSHVFLVLTDMSFWETLQSALALGPFLFRSYVI